MAKDKLINIYFYDTDIIGAYTTHDNVSLVVETLFTADFIVYEAQFAVAKNIAVFPFRFQLSNYLLDNYGIDQHHLWTIITQE